MRYLTAGFTVCLLFFSIQLLTLGQNINISEPVAPPIQVRNTFDLDPFYEQWMDVGGLPVVASAKVNPYALKEAAWLIRQMVGHRPEVLRTLAQNNVRFAVMAHNELTTQIPEHSDLDPDYWDRRARGLGPTPIRPAVSCGEENLLNYPGDPYSTENILVHEFAHAIHEMALNTIIPDFDNRLAATFTAAKQKGLWRNTYAMTNKEEYWAEGTQSWFDTNRANDSEHNHVDTRDKLKRYDPALAKLLKEIFGDTDWRYTRALTRLHLSHLQGFNPQQSPTFMWPLDLEACSQQLTDPDNTGDIAFIDLEPYNLGLLPCLKSQGTDVDAVVTFENQTGGDILYYWIDFEGNARLFGEVAANALYKQSTYVGHVWLVKNRKGKNLAVFSAVEETGRAIIGTTPAPFAEANLAEAGPGPKIEGPWLWMVVPTARKGVSEVAASGKDYLATASKRAVTEQQIAMNGATVGERVKNRVWTLGKLAPTGGNNITDMVNAIGLKKGNIDYHVAYGSITLDAPRRQNTQMYVGSDDSVKVWLNGVLVYNNPADRPANNYQEGFPVTLKKGKNILFVAVYNGIGWWSGFFGFENNAVYSVVPVNPGVISDPNLAIVIRDTLGLAPGKPITKQALKKLTDLEAHPWKIQALTGQEGTIEDLTGLEHATNLRSVSLQDNHIQDIAPLATLTQLETVWLPNNPVRDLSPLANLERLKQVSVNVNKIGTLRKYVDLTQLEALGIHGSGKSIQGLNLLAKLQQLRSLSVVSGKVKNLGFLKNLKQLGDLSLDHNAISNLSPLAGLTQLTFLSLCGNKIGNLKPLAKLTQLTYLYLDDNKIRNVTPLAKLTKLQVLYLANNQIRNVTPLAKLTHLETLSLEGNPVQDLSPLRRLTNLEHVDVEVPGQVAAAPATVAVPNQTALLANYPNPFNPETWIPYHLTVPADVTLTIYAIDGKVVRRLDLGHQAAGFYQSKSRAAYWDGRNTVGERVASGLYVYTLTAGDFTATRKMLILK